MAVAIRNTIWEKRIATSLTLLAMTRVIEVLLIPEISILMIPHRAKKAMGNLLISCNFFQSIL